MLVAKKISGAKKIILITVVIVIFFAIGYLLFSSFGVFKFSVSPTLPVKILPSTVINPVLPADFFKKPPYSRLRQHGSLPVIVGSLGRPNPFLPVPLLP